MNVLFIYLFIIIFLEEEYGKFPEKNAQDIARVTTDIKNT